mgnify:CR=1 FL=1
MKYIILFFAVLIIVLLFAPLRTSHSQAQIPLEAPKLPVVEFKEDIKEYAKRRVLEVFGENHWEAFNKIIWRESKWNHHAQNPRSSAFGLGQFLSSTWKSVGCVKTEEEKMQIDCTIKYIKKNYRNPQKALAFHNQVGWY